MKTKLDLKDICQLKEFSDFLNGCKYTKVVFSFLTFSREKSYFCGVKKSLLEEFIWL